MLGTQSCTRHPLADRLEAFAYLVQNTRRAQVLLPLTGHPRDRSNLKALERVLDEATESILAEMRQEVSTC